MSEDKDKQQFLLGLFGGIAVVSVIGLVVMSVFFLKLSSGKGIVAGQTDQTNQGQDQTAAGQTGPNGAPATVAGVKTFSEKAGAEICKEDGKPVVYLFSTTWCPHCQWIKDAFAATVEKYVNEGKIKAYNWEIDVNDNALTAEKETSIPSEQMAVYKEFNPGGSIPTFVFGCKYYRVGNGFESQDDLASEKAEFEKLIDDLIK